MDKDIILRQVCMNKAALLVHLAYQQYQLRVEGLLCFQRDVCVLQGYPIISPTFPVLRFLLHQCFPHMLGTPPRLLGIRPIPKRPQNLARS